MQRSLNIVLVSVVLVLASVAGIHGSEIAINLVEHRAPDQDRPFSAHFLTSFDPDGIVPGSLGCFDPGGFVFDLEAGGLATHLGASTLLGESEVVFTSGAQCGHAVITAANGDELEFDFGGTAVTDATGNITFDGDWTITGGTGRFGDAQGGGTYEGNACAISGRGE